MSALPLPDVRAGDHVLRSHVLQEVCGELPAVQVPAVQRQVKAERRERHEEQRLAHQRRGKVLPRRDADDAPHAGKAQSQGLL